MFSQFRNILCDPKAFSYWPSRALGMSISLLAALVLHTIGFSARDSILGCAIIWTGQFVLFSINELFMEEQSGNFGNACTIASVIAMFYTISIGLNIYVFCSILILIQPLLRETSNLAIIYIRDKHNWPMGVTLASYLFNEGGKILGMFYAVILSLFSIMDLNYMIWFMLANILFIFYCNDRWSLYTKGLRHFNVPIPHPAKKFLAYGALHNGLAMTMQNILLLAVAGILAGAHNAHNYMPYISMTFSAIMLVGSFVSAYIRQKHDFQPHYSLMSVSILVTTLIMILIYSVLHTWEAHRLTDLQTGFILAILLGAIPAFSGFFSMGMLTFLDLLVVQSSHPHPFNMKKQILNLNTMGNSLAVSISSFIFYFSTADARDFIGIGEKCLVVFIAMEMVLITLFQKLFLSVQKPKTAEEATPNTLIQ